MQYGERYRVGRSSTDQGMLVQTGLLRVQKLLEVLPSRTEARAGIGGIVVSVAAFLPRQRYPLGAWQSLTSP